MLQFAVVSGERSTNYISYRKLAEGAGDSLLIQSELVMRLVWGLLRGLVRHFPPLPDVLRRRNLEEDVTTQGNDVNNSGSYFGIKLLGKQSLPPACGQQADDGADL